MKRLLILVFYFVLFLDNSWSQSISDCQKEIKAECAALNPSDQKKIIYCLSRKSNIIQTSNQLCYQYIKMGLSKLQNDCSLQIRQGCLGSSNSISSNLKINSCLQAKKKNTFILSNPACLQVLNDILAEIEVAVKKGEIVSPSVFSRIDLAPLPVPVVALTSEELTQKDGEKARQKACLKDSKDQEMCRSYSKMELNQEIRMCIDDVLGNLKHKARNNLYYYFVVESYNLCRLVFDTPKEQQKCFSDRKYKSFFRAKNEYEKCSPSMKKCLDTLKSILPSSSESLKREEVSFYYCQKYKEVSEESHVCVAEMLSRGDEFLNNYIEIGHFCNNRPHRTCIERILKINKTENASLKQYKEILSLCQSVESLNKDDLWADCVYQFMNKNKITMQEASFECNQVSASARECLNKCTEKKITYNTCIKDICHYSSSSIQNCLIDLKAPDSRVIGPKTGQEFWFCSLENKEQKACFLDNVKKAEKEIKKAISDGELQYLASSCRKDHKDFAHCLDEYADYFQKYRYNPSATKELGILICEIPVAKIRFCLLESLMSFSKESSTRKQFSFERMYNNCHRLFLTNLITQFQDEDRPQWNCRYSEFENKSLFEQNQECLTLQSKICTKFEQEILPAASLDALKKECPHLKSLTVGFKGPLEKECLKRGLEH